MKLIIILSFFSIYSVEGVSWMDCGSKSAKVVDVNVVGCSTPVCNLKKGTNQTIEITFIPSKPITKATAVVHGEVAGVSVKFPIPNPDGCSGCNLQCPVPADQKSKYSNSIYVSKLYPSVKVVVEWELQDADGNDIFCVKLPTQVVGESAPAKDTHFMSKTRPNHVFKNDKFQKL